MDEVTEEDILEAADRLFAPPPARPEGVSEEEIAEAAQRLFGDATRVLLDREEEKESEPRTAGNVPEEDILEAYEAVKGGSGS